MTCSWWESEPCRYLGKRSLSKGSANVKALRQKHTSCVWGTTGRPSGWNGEEGKNRRWDQEGNGGSGYFWPFRLKLWLLLRVRLTVLVGFSDRIWPVIKWPLTAVLRIDLERRRQRHPQGEDKGGWGSNLVRQYGTVVVRVEVQKVVRFWMYFSGRTGRTCNLHMGCERENRDKLDS